jgi:hypothetical protein
LVNAARRKDKGKRVKVQWEREKVAGSMAVSATGRGSIPLSSTKHLKKMAQRHSGKILTCMDSS